MSRKVPPRCVFCGDRIRKQGPDVLQIVISKPKAEAICLRWHLTRGCADRDPMHQQMADALSEMDPGGEHAMTTIYFDIVKRAARKGAQHLRAVIDVKRDLPFGRLTLRGPGLQWGTLNPRR